MISHACPTKPLNLEWSSTLLSHAVTSALGSPRRNADFLA
jgi:hypothetical protein